MRIVRTLAVALLAAAPALAQFEGVLESRLTGQNMKGTSKSWVAKAGARIEMQMQASAEGAAGAGMKMVILHKTAEPDVSYWVNESAKSYAVIDHRQTEESAKGARDEETYTVKKLGKDTVAGFSCQKGLVTSSKGRQMELCVSSDVLGGSTWFRSMQSRSKPGEGGNLLKALKDAGLEGYPVRWVTKDDEGASMTWELVSAKRQSVPASTFEVPAGYRKSDSLMGAMLSPEAERQMKEAMENMTPEQRKMLEEMMKKQKRQ